MKCARMSDQHQWRNIGRHAAERGVALADVLTKSESINVLVREGYRTAVRRMARKQKGETPC